MLVCLRQLRTDTIDDINSLSFVVRALLASIAIESLTPIPDLVLGDDSLVDSFLDEEFADNVV
jgi:hypothetical protein